MTRTSLLRRLRRTAVAALGLALLTAPDALAGARYASPSSTDTTGDCSLSPCRLDRAVASALPGDEVLVADGTYTVGYQVRATASVTVRPETAGTRPVLVGASGLAFPTLDLDAGGTVRGLQIETTGQSALRLGGGARGEALVLLAGGANGVAAKLVSDPAQTALVNTVAHTTSSFTAIDVIDGATPGHVSMVNVTAIATGSSSWGVTTDMAAQSPVLENSIVRATAKHLHGRSGTQPIAVSTSNFATSGAANWTDVAGNQKDVPVTFADAASLDFHVSAGAPTIDAGAADVLVDGTKDPDGRDRTLGAAPDIGAYEYGTGGTVDPVVDPGGGNDAEPDDRAAGPGAGPGRTVGLPLLPPAAPPILGERVSIDLDRGTVRVRLPGTTSFVALTGASAVPVGSTVDARQGHVELTSVRDGRGATQTGEFWGGVFAVHQTRAKDAYTELALRGGSFRRCPKRSRSRTVAVASGRSKAKGVVRRLWGRDKHGRFRTRGRHAVATVRGTVWRVDDRCDGTLTHVRRGAVSVRDVRTGAKKLVTAGKRHLVRKK